MAPRPATEGRIEPRELETRARNERIAGAARRHHFDRNAPVPFLCECSDPGCEALLRITLAEYRSLRTTGASLVAPGHELA